MHCPSCGTDTTLDQRFCRGCGMGLETVSKLVAAHSSPEMLKREKSLCKKSNELRMYYSLKWGMMAFILGMAMLFLVKTIGLGKGFNLIGGSLLFIAMGWMCYAVLSPMRDGSPASRKFPRGVRTEELPKTDITKELPAARIPVPVASITERTTQLIAADVSGKQSE
jgi:hypothetical protein